MSFWFWFWNIHVVGKLPVGYRANVDNLGAFLLLYLQPVRVSEWTDEWMRIIGDAVGLQKERIFFQEGRWKKCVKVAQI